MTSSTDIMLLYPAIDLEAYFFMRVQRCLAIFNVINGDSCTWWYFKGPWIDIVSLNISIELIYMLLSLETSFLTVIVVFLFITFVIVISCIIIIVVFLFWSTRLFRTTIIIPSGIHMIINVSLAVRNTCTSLSVGHH
ncbi:hypothetical protein BDC45DRAFT_37274 [Circinella umbellata]|nr:hypothetical protein BDC45DRAFT_37274 [Circinella umbellata]